MKILMILPHLGQGGDWVVVRTLSRALRSIGYQVWLTSTTSKNFDRMEFDGFVPLRLNEGPVGWTRSVATIAEFPRDFDVIHAHSPRALLFGILLRRLRCRRSALVLSWHWRTYSSKIRNHIRSWVFAVADRIHLPSEQIACDMSRACDVEAAQMVVIPHAFNAEDWPLRSAAEKRAVRAHFGLSDRDTVMLFAGRLNPEKNIDAILDFFRDFPECVSRNCLRLLLAGSGPKLQWLQARASREGYADLVVFAGYLNPVRKAFVAADLLLLPSTEEETFSLVAVEAAFTGVPCLRSNTGGATEQIVEDVTGVSFPVGDKGEFHRKLEKLAQDPIQLSRMGIAAQAHAAKRFDMRSRVKDYVALYEQAVESRQSRKRPTHPTLKPL